MNSPAHDESSLLGRRVFLAAALLVFMVGAAMRLYDLGARSLRVDEAWVACKVIQTDLADVIFDQGEFHYTYPTGFGVLVHLFYRAFGRGEAALRLFPSLSSIAAIVLFFYLARRLMGRAGALISMSTFAFSYWGVIYGRDLKQYSSDILLTIAATLVADRLVEKRDAARWLAFAACAVLGVWFSQTLVFVLPGLFLAILLVMRREKSWRGFAALCGSGLLTAASFGASYWFFIRKAASNVLLESWDDFFADTSGLLPLLKWTIGRLWSYIVYFFFPQPFFLVAAILALLGLIFLARRNRVNLLYLLSPFVMVYIASLLHRYAFGGERVSLFLLPLVILMVSGGMEWLRSLVSQKRRWVANAGLALLTVGYAYPAFDVSFVHPVRVEEARPVVGKIQQLLAPEDTIYVYNHGRFAFDYYYQGPRAPVYYGHDGRENPQVYYNEIDKLTSNGGRFWFFLSHYLQGRNNDFRLIYEHVTARCAIRNGIQQENAVAFLAICPPPNAGASGQ